MKTSKYLLITVVTLVTLFSVVFSSCSSDDDADTTKPLITLTDPKEGEVLKIGEKVRFVLLLEDNVLLASYKVEIHNNFNGHGHTKAESNTVDFSFSKSWDVSGVKRKEIEHSEISIPENATAGDYHLIVYCTDASGNESHIARNIILSVDGEIM